MMDYQKETLSAYQSMERAKRYKERMTSGVNWTRFSMVREKSCVRKALRTCKVTKDDRILDVPCGTGILGEVLSEFPASVVGSDISVDMMALAKSEYGTNQMKGFVQSDITRLPFKKDAFACVLIIGFMHRVPKEIRQQALKECASLSKRYVIVSCTLRSPVQSLKKWLLKKLHPSYVPAPSPSLLRDLEREFSENGLVVKAMYDVVYFLSSDIIFLLEKARRP